MTTHRTYRKLSQDDTAALIAADRVITLNTKIYKQFALTQMSDVNMLVLLYPFV